MMKKLTVLLVTFIMSVFLLSYAGMNQIQASVQEENATEEIVADTSETGEATAEEEKKGGGLDASEIVLILALILALVSVYFIIMELRKNYYTSVTLDEMKEKRKDEGLKPEMTEEEINQASEKLEEAFSLWGNVETGVDPESGEEIEYRNPSGKKQVNKSVALLEEVKAMYPTDQAVVDRMNELGEVVKYNMKRKFAGSKWVFIVIVLGQLLIMTMMGWTFGNFLKTWLIWGGGIYYYFASLAPRYLIEKRLKNFGKFKITSGILAGIFGALMSTPVTQDVVTHWDDGSKSRSTELNAGFFIMIIIAVLAIMAIAFFNIVLGVIAFFRNFVLYF